MQTSNKKNDFMLTFRFDILLISFGVIFSIASGAINPAFAFFFGEFIDAFHKPPGEMYDSVVEISLMIVGLAGFAALARGGIAFISFVIHR